MADKESRSNAASTIIAALITGVCTLIVGFVGAKVMDRVVINEAKVSVEKITVQLNNQIEENTQLTNNNQTLENDNTALEQKVADLESQLGIVQGEQDSAKESSEQLQQQYDELKKQYSEISAQNDAIKVQLDNMGIDIPQTKDSPEENSTLESDSVWINNLEWLDISGDWEFGKVTKGNTGIEYSHSINNTKSFTSTYSDFNSYNETHYITYKLYGQYSRITGYLYQEFYYRNADGVVSLRLYNEDNSLLNKEQYTIARGSDPVSFDIDVTGVDNLRIELVGSVGHAALGEVALWK